jgi:hypothetical protein
LRSFGRGLVRNRRTGNYKQGRKSALGKLGDAKIVRIIDTHTVVIYRVQLHIQTLINLISTFPTINPTPGQDAPVSLSESNPSSSALTRSQEEPDLSVLLERIRARYKLLCSALGIRPRLAVASLPGPNETYGEEGEGVQGQNGNAGTEGGSSLVQGVEGSGVGRGMIDGVDTRLLRF